MSDKAVELSHFLSLGCIYWLNLLFILLRYQVYPVFSSILNTLFIPCISTEQPVSKVVYSPLDSSSLKTSMQAATNLIGPKILPLLGDHCNYFFFLNNKKEQKKKKPPKHKALI